jgi:hypothetical protein
VHPVNVTPVAVTVEQLGGRSGETFGTADRPAIGVTSVGESVSNPSAKFAALIRAVWAEKPVSAVMPDSKRGSARPIAEDVV